MGLDGYRVHGQLRRQWGIKFPANKDFYPILYNAYTNTNTTQIHHHQRPVQIRQKHGESSRNKDFIETPLVVVRPTQVWETVGKTEESLVIRARHLDKVLDVTIRHCHQGWKRCHHQRTRYSQNSRELYQSTVRGFTTSFDDYQVTY